MARKKNVEQLPGVEVTDAIKTNYWHFPVTPDRAEIWKALACYRVRFRKTPSMVLTSPTDGVIRSMLLGIGVDAQIGQDVPDGQLWFFVPGGYYQEAES